MTMIRPVSRASLFVAAITVFSACRDQLVEPDAGSSNPPAVTPLPAKLTVLGLGSVAERYTAEVSVRGDFAYTTTWNIRVTSVQNPGNAINVWNVSGNTPVLLETVLVENATTLGDVQISDDGRFLFVATEPVGSLVVYDIAIPSKPILVSRFTNEHISPGVHTAEVQRVNGIQYAFLSVDPGGGSRARLVIVNLNDPGNPTEVFSAEMGNPYVHDVFVRNGILFTALWNDGVQIFDIGGGGKGGSPSNPISLGAVKTAGGQVHNIWWYQDPAGARKFAFVGQEGAGAIGVRSAGDIHVIDVSNLASPREVAFFTVANAGTHNFSVDEANGILYAAYYNAGVQVLDISGDLGACPPIQRAPDGRCDLTKMGRLKATGLTNNSSPVYVWGVQFLGGNLYASDMLNGLWRLRGYP